MPACKLPRQKIDKLMKYRHDEGKDVQRLGGGGALQQFQAVGYGLHIYPPAFAPSEPSGG
jgi:hypothetical protein